MKTAGLVLIVVGVGLVVWALLSPVTVTPDLTALEAAGGSFPQTIVNLELLQQQMVLLETGLACFVAGTVAACIGSLRNALVAAGNAKIVYRPGWEPDTPIKE